MKKVVIIGGGTGTYVVLSGLKKFSLDLSAIVSMTDSGGSTGKLRDQLGVLPPGDLRQCLVALSNASFLWRKLFLYRFTSGDFQGHNFGNVFLAALEKINKNYEKAIEMASEILQTKGKVIPVTLKNTHLKAYYEDGKVITGEGLIDENNFHRAKIKKIILQPKVRANKKAIESIIQADYLIIGPGDLYTSIIPVLLPEGIVQAFQKTKGKIIYILNLMTKAGQTTNYKASDHLNDLILYLKRKPDIVLVNNKKIPKEILDVYQQYHEKQVIDDLKKKDYHIIRTDLLDDRKVKKNKYDILYRSLVRHDSKKLAQVLKNIFYA